jgi:hypothetical protein
MSDFFGIPRGRLPIAIAMVIALAAGLSWLQGKFDTSDVKKGISIALGYKPAAQGPTVFDAIVARREGDPRCDGQIVSTFFGDVRVSCQTPGRPDVSYDFRVLLDGKKPPKAESSPAEALLSSLGVPQASDGGR